MKKVIIGGRLIDGTGRNPVDNSLIIVENEYITYAGEINESVIAEKCPDQYEKIDARGLTVIPGIIDCHIHLCGILGKDVRDWVLESKTQQAIVSVTEAERLINCGITTVCDVSQNGLYLKKLVQTSKIVGPRIIACGRGLCRLGGYIDFSGLPVEAINELHPWAVICDGVAEIRKCIRKLVREGADGVKIWATSSGVAKRPTDTDQHYSYEEMQIAVEEAEFIKMPIFAHCKSIQVTKTALSAGIKNIIHGGELDEECLELMKQKNTIFMPTLKTTLDWLEYNYDEIPLRKNLNAYPGATIEEKEYNRIKNNFKKVYEREIKIAVASDTFCQAVTPYGVTTLQELYAMADAGMSLMDVIVSATKIGAEAIGMSQFIGTIEQGKLADLLIIEKNPLEDIRHISPENMSLIMQNGQHIKSDERCIDYE